MSSAPGMNGAGTASAAPNDQPGERSRPATSSPSAARAACPRWLGRSGGDLLVWRRQDRDVEVRRMPLLRCLDRSAAFRGEERLAEPREAAPVWPAEIDRDTRWMHGQLRAVREFARTRA